MTERLMRFASEEDAVDLVEYAFVVGFLAIACYVGMTTLSGSLAGFFGKVITSLSGILP